MKYFFSGEKLNPHKMMYCSPSDCMCCTPKNPARIFISTRGRIAHLCNLFYFTLAPAHYINSPRWVWKDSVGKKKSERVAEVEMAKIGYMGRKKSPSHLKSWRTVWHYSALVSGSSFVHYSVFESHSFNLISWKFLRWTTKAMVVFFLLFLCMSHEFKSFAPFNCECQDSLKRRNFC